MKDVTSAVDEALGTLKVHDRSVNWKTADELAGVGPPAVPKLVEALSDRDGYVREADAMSLTYAQEIVAAINWLLGETGRRPLEIGHITFALDTDVSYEGQWTIPASKLIGPERLDGKIEPMVSGGPSWIHANLIPTTDHRSLITLIFGARVGNPQPTVNVSLEGHWDVKVVEDD